MVKILVIDDERSIRNTLKEILGFEGYSVEVAENGILGLEIVKNADFDIILCDIKMPEMDGIEVLGKILEIKPETTVVMISGHGNIDTAVEAIKKGAFDFIVKPLDLNRLLIYGKPDGTIADTPQRQVYSLLDAIICGEGEGPMSPSPVRCGLLLMGTSSAATDWVACNILGLNPLKIPTIREAFGEFRLPLANFSPGKIQIKFEDDIISTKDLIHQIGIKALPSRWWRGHCEL